MIELLANSLVPIFVGLLFGYAAGVRKVVDNKNVKTLVSFLMTFALPCYLFVTMASTPRELLWGQVKPALVFAIVYTALFVATYYASRNLSKDTAANSAVLALTLGFPNAAAVGIPLLLAVYGPRDSVTVAVPGSWCDYDHPDYSRDSGKRYRCRSDTFSLNSHPRISVECSQEPGILGSCSRRYLSGRQVPHASLC